MNSTNTLGDASVNGLPAENNGERGVEREEEEEEEEGEDAEVVSVDSSIDGNFLIFKKVIFLVL